MDAPNLRTRNRDLTHFAAALDLCIAANGYSSYSLVKEMYRSDGREKIRALQLWRAGQNLPRHRTSFRTLGRIEQHLQLDEGRFARIIAIGQSSRQHILRQLNSSKHWIVQWHLPANFDERSPTEQQGISRWLSQNVLAGITDYGSYQQNASQTKYSVVFPTVPVSLGGRPAHGKTVENSREMGKQGSYGTIVAPQRLAAEMEDLVAFKTRALPPIGYQRYQRWVPATSQYMVRRYGHLFGALSAAQFSNAQGLGISPSKLTFGLLVFPAVWDWFLAWSERKRGFFTMSERSILYEAKSTTRRASGWLRQHPELARHLQPIDGLVSASDISAARKDWALTCETAHNYACGRLVEIQRVGRMHRDPTTAILSVLNSERPLNEYKKIADEILRMMPDEALYPKRAAVASRAYLMMRLAIHLGLRQRNLRELLFCNRGRKHRTAQQLEHLRRGELRWSETADGWEVFIPAVAFKNGRSSYFRGRPFQVALADLEGLYGWINSYIERHRSTLLNGVDDPGTFFVRRVRYPNIAPEFDCLSFYEAWKDMIRRYGIYNPFTGRGAIAGLLPHGPHCVRDVLATHILKETGSYELAGFAIQDTVTSVMRHYARFLPHEKAARAAAIVNKAWQ
jgi:hypothetical protein